MTREQLEHLIRAAVDVVADDVVVIGSQSVLGAFPDAPSTLLRSMEADLYPRARLEQTDLIDDALGDGSPFHSSYGYYAHTVGPEAPIAPAGWEERLLLVEVAIKGGVARAWCMEPHDLVVAKLAAGRERDIDFADDAVRHGLVTLPVLKERTATLRPPHTALVAARLAGVAARTRGS